MSRRRVVEDPVSHERWLVSYADFITLLFAFFVVMYSISQVNEGKYKVLSETLTKAFTSTELDTGKSEPELTLDPFQVGEIAQSNPRNVIPLNAPIIKQNEGDRDAKQEGIITEQGGLPTELNDLSNKLDEAYGDLIKSDMVTLRGNEEWLEIELQSSLLFDSGDARLSTGALELLGSIAELLRGNDNPVRVEGFTDNVPIHSVAFPSNWELSTARAAAVVQLFIEEGLNPSRFAAIGYGEFQPVADNNSEQGRAKNRRVVLMISKTGELRPALRELTTAEELQNEQLQQEVTATPEPSPTTGIQILIPGVNQESEQQAEPTPDTKPATDELEGIKTIELEDGGLLFTRDRAAGK